METIKINVGEKFIYKSKYGGVVKGIIAGVGQSYRFDTQNGAIVKVYTIISSELVEYKLSEISIVTEFLTKEEGEQIDASLKKFTEMKGDMEKKNIVK